MFNKNVLKLIFLLEQLLLLLQNKAFQKMKPSFEIKWGVSFLFILHSFNVFLIANLMKLIKLLGFLQAF